MNRQQDWYEEEDYSPDDMEEFKEMSIPPICPICKISLTWKYHDIKTCITIGKDAEKAMQLIEDED